MERNKILILLAAFIMALYGCKNDDDTPSPAPVQTAEETTVNVDVILPKSIQAAWANSIDWAMENITGAQRNLDRKVVLNLRYHDEDTEDIDKLAYALTHPEEGDDTCHAIIGPYHSSNAKTILRYADRNRLPVIMPTCTGAELQRTNSKSTFAWFLTESDVTQCEMMVSVSASTDHKKIALVYSDDEYGQSFRDWFGYYAAEHQLKLCGDGMLAYKKSTDISSFLNSIKADYENSGEDMMICLALSDGGYYEDFTDKLKNWNHEYNGDYEYWMYYEIMGSDVAFDDDVIGNDNVHLSHGITPYGSPTFGFPQMYESKFGSMPKIGYAQIYDALELIALGALHQIVNGETCLVNGVQVSYNEKPFGPGLTDHIRSVVSSPNGSETTGCTLDGLTYAFSEILEGRDIDLIGATGDLKFDSETSTKILNTTYLFWDYAYDDNNNRICRPMAYLSTTGSFGQASTSLVWEMDKRWNQQIDDISVNHALPALTDRWAVVISPSTTWANYRHQADAFAMYQTLRSHGYDDDHIVLIVEDNLADDSHNIYPGEIFVERNDNGSTSNLFANDNVRLDAVVDYHFSDLTQDDIADIMLGRKSDRLPHVISPTSGSDVVFFWSGHGGSQDGPLWGNEDARQYFGSQRIRNIVKEMDDNDMYRRILFAVETCYSGKWGEALDGLSDVLVLTAATPAETSKADMYDSKLGVYLSNAFARTFRRQINQSPDITVYNLYRELFKTTKGSHVSLYNQQNYGSVYSETMKEFLE